MSHKTKPKRLEYCRNRRARFIEAGLCSKCGRCAPAPGFRKCELCRSKGVAALHKSKNKKIALGVCSRCSSPVVPGHSMCQEHLDRLKMLGGQRKPETRHREQMVYRRRLKQQVIDLLGKVCECCGETELAFLTIDHVNGDGAKHRREDVRSQDIYRLLRQGQDTGYELRVLCWNCNMAIGAYGACPHQDAKVFERVFIPGKEARDG